MDLEKCSNDFLIDNKIKKNRNKDTNDNLNNIHFEKIFNEAIQKNLNVPNEKINTKLSLEEENALKKLQEPDASGYTRLEKRHKIDVAVNKLASFFRIGVNLMMAILQSLGIPPEDLIDETKKTVILDMLTKYFLLSDKQREKLEKLLDTFYK